MLCLREPSLGPSFGMKGGAAGGGYAQVVPMEDINLHFTGDFHAITSANNLLAAMIDNHIYWGNALGIDQRRVAWRRVHGHERPRAALDRLLARRRRQRLPARGRLRHHGRVRGDGDLLPRRAISTISRSASATSSSAYTRDRKPVRAGDLKAHGAMTALLKEALAPNLVQTLEGTPAFIHGGPFANIAHGCNSVLATTTALKLCDYVVTEAGFGADLGGEKFLDIKCRKTGLSPDCAVLVATIRALKMHGGVKKEDLKNENLKALEAGMANLARHVENVQKFGIVPVISINRFSADTDAEIALVKEHCQEARRRGRHGRPLGRGRRGRGRRGARGGEGGRQRQEQAQAALSRRDAAASRRSAPSPRKSTAPRTSRPTSPVRDQLAQFEQMGYGKLPVCIAKTQYSFSTNADTKGAPIDHTIPVREVRLSAGAEFVVAICGEIMTMPGPAAGAGRRLHRRRRGRQDRRTVLILGPPLGS